MSKICLFNNSAKVKKSHYSLVKICITLIGFSSFAPLPLLAMTYRDNTVDLPVTASGYKLVNGKYVINSFNITSGQDPKGNINNGTTRTWSGNSASINYQIGRSGSKGVANWFSSNIKANQTTFNHDPGDLNFAFLGTMTLTLSGGVLGKNQDTYTIPNVTLAQGHAGLSNNWWFGGKTCSYQGNNMVRCSGTSSAGYAATFDFRRGGSGNPVNSVELKNINIPQYTTYGLQSDYSGENTRCVWQPSSQCPPFVTYYNSTQSATIKLSVANNRLYNAQGALFDTTRANLSHSGQPAAIFVMDGSGNIYASNQNKVYLFHHSSLLAGTSVSAAGELFVKAGVIQSATNCSGHYRTPNTSMVQLRDSLNRQGYSGTYAVDYCSDDQMKRILKSQGVAP
ncbi:hypothetical protein AB8989_05130 [Yersinia hibernica]|uniref:Fimbrial protein n=1 Tax=Yersinia hibernica TaxID=2339259 RepID=A0ABX5R053_9GAMM|nr:hypothetical protein [Yersinia hibernica]QAX78681.1 hypothetical protein D5F51_08980 [Yersinia hibernica]